MHETQKVIIAKEDIDVGMVELIKVLNKFPCITTLYCCQGDADENGRLSGCYTAFDCVSPKRLQDLARLICKPQLGTISIFYQSDALDGRIMWTLDIHSVERRNLIIKVLTKWTNEHKKHS
jgi:hypothetical protein